MAFDGVMEMDGWMEWNTYVHALKKKKKKKNENLVMFILELRGDAR